MLIGAAALGKFLPMLTTAAGNISPAKVFVIGAGVAGLQAIATARRLGAVVSAFDVRPAAREQVLSLGATFVANELVPRRPRRPAATRGRRPPRSEADTPRRDGGGHPQGSDLVVTTAADPGRPAPELITPRWWRTMRPGSVIVDLAAETGGNCELTRSPARRWWSDEVTIIGAAQLAGHRAVPRQPDVRPQHLELLVQHLVRRTARSARPEDEITGAMLIDPRTGRCREGADGDAAIIELYVFVLAAFVGYQVIPRVPPLLHTPLMAATNAISGISLVGSLMRPAPTGTPCRDDARLHRRHRGHASTWSAASSSPTGC